MKIATLNVNSINARLPQLTSWLQKNKPDVVLLQEIKCEFNNFPFLDLQMAGYEAKILGQKSYNGVAVLSRLPLQTRQENLPQFADEQARYLEVETLINGQKYIFASVYVPNGNPPATSPQDTSRFSYKLSWLDAFLQHAENLLKSGQNVVICGDFNVMLSPLDVYNPELFAGGALYCPEVWNKINRLQFIGYTDAFRQLYPKTSGYTYWDYGPTAFANDLGLRIDYIFTSPAVTDKLENCHIDRDLRQQEKSSDHTALWASFKD